MAVKKSEIKNLVQNEWNKKVNALRKECNEATHRHEREQLKPYDALFKEVFEAENKYTEALNKVTDKLTEDEIRIYGFTYLRSPKYGTDFESNMENVVQELYNGAIKGTEAVAQPYEEEIRKINEAYRGVMSNVIQLTPKKGLDYIIKMGFDVTSITPTTAEVPMVVVDPEALKLDK